MIIDIYEFLFLKIFIFCYNNIIYFQKKYTQWLCCQITRIPFVNWCILIELNFSSLLYFYFDIFWWKMHFFAYEIRLSIHCSIRIMSSLGSRVFNPVTQTWISELLLLLVLFGIFLSLVSVGNFSRSDESCK